MESSRHFAKAFVRRGHKFDKGRKNINKAIFIINIRGKITPTKLGSFVDLRKSTLTAIVDVIESEGFVKVESDPNDRRKKWISLTEKGKEHAAEREKILYEIISDSFSSLDENDVEKLITGMETIVEVFKKIEG